MLVSSSGPFLCVHSGIVTINGVLNERDIPWVRFRDPYYNNIVLIAHTCSHLTILIITSLHFLGGVGCLEHLLQYETERQQSTVPVMAAAEGLNWLYTSTLTPFTLLRSIGLNLTNALPPVKVG